MLALVRINLFIRVILKASYGLKAAILAAWSSPKSWLRAVESDLKMIQPFTDDYKAIGSMTQWITTIQADPHAARRAFKRAALQKSANQLSREVLSVTGAPIGDRIFCRYCRYSCHDTTSRAAHEYKAHGVKLCSRRYIGPSLTCRVCLKMYRTRDLAIRHLSKSQNCLKQMVRCIAPYEKEEAKQLDEDATQIRKVKPKGMKNAVAHKLGPRRVSGPLRKFDEEDELLFSLLGEDWKADSEDEDTLIKDLIASNG